MPAPKPGALVSESDLATAAAEALDAAGVTRADAARTLKLSGSAVTMALAPERYPNKGHATRRKLLREYAGLVADGPLFRLRAATSADGSPDAPA